MSFNRTVQKYHRYRLFLDWVKGNFSDSYFSFLNLYDFYEHEISEIKKQYGDSYCNELEKLLPIELDTQNVRRNDNLVEWNKTSNNFKKELFLDSCINIVTETTFCGEELFISEKIVKPILAFQPFIVLGPYGYLKELKKLGFKTFDSIWDERYDDEVNYEKRYDKVLKLILKLTKTI